MKLNLMKFLVCPNCKESLDLTILKEDREEISEGVLICKVCNEAYPIVRYIPRLFYKAMLHYPKFITENRSILDKYSWRKQKQHKMAKLFRKQLSGVRSFSVEWSALDYNKDKIWGWSLEEQTSYYLLELDCQENNLSGKIIVDAGCGHGKITNKFAEMGAMSIGIDLSSSIDRANHNKTNSNCHFIQADVMKPPLLANQFDIVFSSGVIHHTSDPHKTFNSLSSLVKSGGELCVWVYHATLMKRFLLDPLRYILSRFPMPAQNISLIIFYIPYTLREKIKNLPKHNKENRTFSERYVVMRDQLCPKYAYHYKPEEIYSWYKNLGFNDIKKTTEISNGFSMIGFAP